jgi:pimeloyl-ACP methyl ester carboxylesterase
MKTTTELIEAIKVTHHYATINGIKYHYAEAGKGPLVIMLHGAFELWYSWREQLTALANAGYHAVAPDLRGFGESEVTPNVRDYSLFQHARDVKALIDHIGTKEVVVVGHDWGANLTWLMPMLYPETIKAIVVLSIPFYPEPRDPEKMKNYFRDKFSFMGYFQKPGAAEAEFNQDPQRFFRLFLYGFSGDAPPDTVNNLFANKPADAKLLDGFPEPSKLPSWLSQKDIDYYANAYKKPGLTGTLNFYRNVNEDYPLLKDAYKNKITQPVLFIGGGEEAAVKFGDLESMKNALPNLRSTIVLEGCGHYIQQERMEELNAALIDFLNNEIKK